MKKLLTIAFTTLTLLSFSQKLDIAKAINSVTRSKTTEISSILINEESGVIIVYGKNGGCFKIIDYPGKDIKFKKTFSDPKYYSAESQLEVISVSFGDGKGTYKNLTRNTTIEFRYE